ncbi:MAG TPA: ABC transporter permease [Dongiaceae bacterium]|nr:ABC transporter permease [Dongiaceae bacterium]
MLTYAAKRLGLAVLVVAVVIVVLFLMIYIIPGDPLSVALGPRANPVQVEALRQRMGLDQPIYIQLLRFYGSVLTGNLGNDILSEEPVLPIIMTLLPDTLFLILGAMSWSILLGIPLGCLSAMYPGSLMDRIAAVLSVSVIAVPAFVVAVYALLVFSIWLRWFPAIGAGDGVLDGLYHLVLPSLALGLGWVGYIARMLRASILEVQGENHVRTARAFGLSENKVIFDYVLRIAVLPTLTVLGIGIGQLLSGAVFAEIVFARPGIGKLVYDAILTRNYPIVSGTVLVTTFFFVLVNVLADLMIAWLDPRVRHGLQR